MERTEHWSDLGFTCCAVADDREGGPYYVEWKLYTLYEGSTTDGKPWRGWQRAGSDCSPDTVDTLDEAEIYADGTTKWDGCSNWTFQDSCRDGCEHTCGRAGMVAIGLLLARVHDLCGEMMPSRRDFKPEPLPKIEVAQDESLDFSDNDDEHSGV